MKKPDLSFEALEPFFDKIEKLSQLHRILISSGIFLLVIGLFVWLLYVPKYKTIGELETNLSNLQEQLRKAKADARDLKKFQQQMKKAEARFRLAKKSLPEKEEIPSLLSSISQSGKDSGLEFTLFQPKGERAKDFYAEIPVNIQVSGKFHNVALFFDKVARLPRVVNIRDIKMKPKKKTNSLETTCTAVTYKFIEKAPQKKKKKKTRKKK
jgi:type IV pilus assembly protein PilO